MNDRLKFRVWNTNEKIMRDVIDYWMRSDGVVSHITVRIPEGECEVWWHEDPELMQCTGAKNKSGTLIYEGDIIHIGDKNIRYIIEWHDTGFMGKAIGASNWIGLNAWNDKIEIMGNIWENQELLERGREDEKTKIK